MKKIPMSAEISTHKFWSLQVNPDIFANVFDCLLDCNENDFYIV